MTAGGRRSTTWGPGQGGNPKPRQKVIPEVREAAQEYTQEALERLAQWMRSKHPGASTTAAQALLDRGHGKPVQSHDVRHHVPAAVAADADLAAIALAGSSVVTTAETDQGGPDGMVH